MATRALAQCFYVAQERFSRLLFGEGNVFHLLLPLMF
jgi:hypothetical protein